MNKTTEVTIQSLKDDFGLFLRYIWNHLGLPPPTPIQLDIAHYLQHGPKRKIVMAFRGVGKSWITASFVCWRLLRDHEEKIMVVSASKVLANNFSTFVKRLISEVPILLYLQPRDGQRASMIEFDVGPSKASKDPSVKSVGITGQLTGSRASLIISDDVEVPNNSLTTIQREKLGELVKEYDAILKPGGEVCYLGTPQTEESVYNTLMTRGYECRIWPARYPEDIASYKGRLAPRIIAALEADNTIVGKPTDPKRFSAFDLEAREMSYGRSGFALQFMLDTSLNDANRYPLKLRDLIVFPLSPDIAPSRFQWASSMEYAVDGLPLVGLQGDRYYRPMWVSQEYQDYQGACMFVDPAGMGKDETAIAVVRYLNGNLFLAECRGFTGGYTPENLTSIAKLAKTHKVSIIRVEENFGQGMFSELLKPYLEKVHPCEVENVRSSQQKERRIIDTLEPVLNQHRLIVDEALIKRDMDNYNGHDHERALLYTLFYQLTRITKDKGALAHDDRLDAVAGAVFYWVESMALDDEKGVRLHLEQVWQQEIDSFEEGVINSFGNTPSRPTHRPTILDYLHRQG